MSQASRRMKELRGRRQLCRRSRPEKCRRFDDAGRGRDSCVTVASRIRQPFRGERRRSRPGGGNRLNRRVATGGVRHVLAWKAHGLQRPHTKRQPTADGRRLARGRVGGRRRRSGRRDQRGMHAVRHRGMSNRRCGRTRDRRPQQTFRRQRRREAEGYGQRREGEEQPVNGDMAGRRPQAHRAVAGMPADPLAPQWCLPTVPLGGGRVLIWRIAIATSQGRKLAGSRRPGRSRTTRSRVSWTTSSTSTCPLSARPTRLYSSGRCAAISSPNAWSSPRCAATTARPHQAMSAVLVPNRSCIALCAVACTRHGATSRPRTRSAYCRSGVS